MVLMHRQIRAVLSPWESLRFSDSKRAKTALRRINTTACAWPWARAARPAAPGPGPGPRAGAPAAAGHELRDQLAASLEAGAGGTSTAGAPAAFGAPAGAWRNEIDYRPRWKAGAVKDWGYPVQARPARF